MQRCKHGTFGLGIVSEEFVSGSGQTVARVVFDARPDEERIILISCLSESNAKLPDAATKPKVRKPRTKKQKVEAISDELIVPELDDSKRLDFTSGFESRDEL